VSFVITWKVQDTNASMSTQAANTIKSLRVVRLRHTGIEKVFKLTECAF